MLYGMAAEAAAKTAWPPKVIALGRVLAQGLLGDGDEIDLVQYALAAMTEMERIHVELLELPVRFTAVIHMGPQEEVKHVEAVKRGTSVEMITPVRAGGSRSYLRGRIRPATQSLISRNLIAVMSALLPRLGRCATGH